MQFARAKSCAEKSRTAVIIAVWLGAGAAISVSEWGIYGLTIRFRTEEEEDASSLEDLFSRISSFNMKFAGRAVYQPSRALSVNPS